MKSLSKISTLAHWHISTLFLLLSFGVFAQNGGRKQIESAKIALITNRLNLTPEQAQTFWPLYREYDAKHRDIRKNQRSLIAEVNTLTTADDKILADLRELQAFRQKEVDLEKDYMGRFLKILNPRQLAELYKTEQMFTQMLLQKLNKNNKGE